MFENSQVEGGLACQPDPEDMLQRTRLAKEKAIKANSLLKEFVDTGIDLYGQDNEKAMIQLLGAVQVKIHLAEKDEQRWLKEIDK